MVNEARAMESVRFHTVLAVRYLVLLWLIALGGGCGAPEAIVAGVAGVTMIGSGIPAQEIEQIYYLGVFDPREQIPSAIFRLTVRGQASAISGMRFACGWVPANVVDSLSTDLSFQNDKVVLPSAEERKALESIKTGRRLILFGPEGFREAPRSHRLVLVMGSSPEKFFQAVGQTLESVAKMEAEELDTQAGRKILAKLEELRRNRMELEVLREDVFRDMVTAQGDL